MGDHMFVVTGGPGSGKTSLIDALTRRGFHRLPQGRTSHHTGSSANRRNVPAMGRQVDVCRTHAGLGVALMA